MKVYIDYAIIKGTHFYHEGLKKWVKATEDNYTVHIFAIQMPETADYIKDGVDRKYHAERSWKYLEFKYDIASKNGEHTPAYYYLKTKFQNMDLTKGCSTLWDCLNEITGRYIDLNESFIYDECGVYNGSYWNGLDYKEAYKLHEKETEGKYSYYIKSCIGEVEIIRFNDKNEANEYYKKHNGIYVDENGFTYRLESKVRGY